MTISQEFPSLIAAGFLAQLIDGSVGMGYGICSSTILVAIGIPPAVTSSTVHAAGVVTSGVSSVSHAWFGNIDRRIFLSLLTPGVIGGIIGALFLAPVPTRVVQPFVWAYLLVTSLVVLFRVILFRRPIAVRMQGTRLGAVAGFLDAIGGGGWGTIVTSTMIARGVTPRYAIGTANAVVFFVALSISVALRFQLDQARYDLVLALLIGGAAAAPLAAWVTSHVPQRAAAVAVGVFVFVLGVTGLFDTLT